MQCMDINGMAQHLTRSVWKQFFNKCCTSNPVDGSDMLWNGSEKNVHVWSECEEDHGIDCEDRDSDIDW